MTGAYQAAAEAIGLKVKLKSVSANNYINFFIDAKARAGIDGFITVNYGDYADPAALLATVVLPGRVAELRRVQQPQDDLVARVRPAARRIPNKRAELVAEAEKIAAVQLPWIPDVQPTNIVLMHKGLHRRCGLVLVHVRAVGGPPRWDRLRLVRLRFYRPPAG